MEDVRKEILHISATQLFSKLNNGYRALLGGDIEQDSLDKEQLAEFGRLIQMDIVGFAKFGEHPDTLTIDRDAMLILEGRRQLALHMLKHLDMSARQIIETLNDSILQNEETFDE